MAYLYYFFIVKFKLDFKKRERATEVMGYSWGGSTNIEAAFDIVLLIATSNKLSQVKQETCIKLIQVEKGCSVCVCIISPVLHHK